MTKFTKFAVAAAFAFGFVSIASAATVTVPPTLMVGSTGQEVMDVQTILGITADGSFGPMTQASVMAFQSSHALTADGKVGPMTAAAMNAMTPVTPTPTPTEDGDEDTDEDTGFDGTLSGEGEPNDIDVNDADDTEVKEGEEEAELGSIEFTAEDGDIMISRVDVIFEADGGNDEMDAWNTFDSVSLVVDGDVIDEMDTDAKADWDETDTDDVYRLRFSGLDFVAEEDADIEIFVVANVASSIDGVSDGETWDISFETELSDAGGLRYEDADGFVDDFGSSDTANFDIEAPGTDSELDISESDESPEASTLEVKDTATSTHTLGIFTVEADEDGGDILFTDFPVSVDVTNSGVTPADVVDEVMIDFNGESYDGDYVSESCGATEITFDLCDDGDTATFSFDNLEDDEIVLEAGEEMDVEVSVKFTSQNSGGYADLTDVYVETDLTSSDVEDADSGDDIGTIGSNETADTFEIASTGLLVESVDESAVKTFTADDAGEGDQGTFIIEFDVTAFGDDIYLDKSTPVEDNDGTYATTALAYSVTNDGSNTTAATMSIDGDYDEETNSYKISEGDTATITLEVTVSATADSSAAITLESLGYALTNVDGTLGFTVQDEPEFETNSITLLFV